MSDMNEIRQREHALVDALASMGRMRACMKRAQPGAEHDCWWTVIASLCTIAQSIRDAEQRALREAAREE